MLIRIVFMLLIAGTLAARAIPAAAQGADAIPGTTGTSPEIARHREDTRVRDSLITIADRSTGSARKLIEELIWQRQAALHRNVLAMADRIRAEAKRGGDVAALRRTFDEEVRRGWPSYLAQLERRQKSLQDLNRAAEAATGAERLALESDATRESERLLEDVQSSVDEIVALGQAGIDVTEARAYLKRELSLASHALLTRVQLVSRDQDVAAARLSHEASNAEVRLTYEAAGERLKRATRSLGTAIRLMDHLGLETRDLKVAQIAATHRITADVFDWKVFLGLMKTLWDETLEFLASKALFWVFQVLLIVLTFVGFRALSRLVRRIVQEAVKYSDFSQLMRSTIIRLAGSGVMLIGFVIILTQLGVEIAPLLAGLGIAGVVVGFAMQNTLSNFAAGGMILGNQPYDVGDEIEVAGIVGVVKRMSLVCTTILTPDNQTLIVPNSTIWGGVIRNRTAQPIRRVDLIFSIGYRDDLERAERVLREVVAANSNVLENPPSVIRMHQLGPSSVDYAVRVWTAKERFDEVAWNLTRAVKLRFDVEGISIPYPQRELHVNVNRSEAEGALAALPPQTPAT